MAKKRLEQCRSGRDFVNYATSNGADVRNGKGSHHIVSTDNGSCVVPLHNKDLGKGLRSKIIKTFVVIGLGILLYLWLVA